MAEYQRYIPIRGDKAQRYQDVITGEVISNRAFRAIHKASKNEPLTYLDPIDNKDRAIAREYRERQHELGLRASERDMSAIKIGLESTQGEVASTHHATGKPTKMYPPDSPRARALIAMGRRQSEWDWWVGDTPENV
jgi:hypothetical protein